MNGQHTAKFHGVDFWGRALFVRSLPDGRKKFYCVTDFLISGLDSETQIQHVIEKVNDGTFELNTVSPGGEPDFPVTNITLEPLAITPGDKDDEKKAP